MKTAIEWLLNEQHLLNIDDSLTKMQYLSKRKKMERQAIEKEKEQIVKAFNDGHHADVGHIDKAWEYFNQTYNN
jgi:hypothetical protein